MFRLLDLPKEIRQRIYELAGLLSGVTLPLVPKGKHNNDIIALRGDIDFTRHILGTCKLVHEEVKTLICARNTLVVIYEYVEYGLAFLRQLSPEQCSALTTLFVQLHLEAPPEQPVGIQRKPPAQSQPLSPARISSWQAAARNILANTTPQRLNFHLFCDTGRRSDIAKAILQPLRDHPGVLKNCAIRLDQDKRNSPARHLAYETAFYAQGLDPRLRTGRFRFFDLPAEIRRQILVYTDLVTPYNEVYWSYRRGFRVLAHKGYCYYEEDCDPRLHPGCRYMSCAKSGSYLTGYICTVAWSAYSSHCQCWTAPRSLFLGSRALYREALQVLYSTNRVIILQSKGVRSWLDPLETTTRLDISRFITRHMWPDVLHDLRELEFIIPAVDPPSGVTPSAPYYRDFCFAVDHLKSHANVSRLTIIVNMTTARTVLKGHTKSIKRELATSLGDKSMVFRAHADLLAPLKALDSMQRFFIHVEWAWHWFRDEPRIGSHSPNEQPTIGANRLESRLEGFVMGNQYDSKSAGKMEERPSIWLYEVWNTLEFLWWADMPPDFQPM